MDRNLQTPTLENTYIVNEKGQFYNLKDSILAFAVIIVQVTKNSFKKSGIS